jgi:hypothetical protein
MEEDDEAPSDALALALRGIRSPLAAAAAAAAASASPRREPPPSPLLRGVTEHDLRFEALDAEAAEGFGAEPTLAHAAGVDLRADAVVLAASPLMARSRKRRRRASSGRGKALEVEAEAALPPIDFLRGGPESPAVAATAASSNAATVSAPSLPLAAASPTRRLRLRFSAAAAAEEAASAPHTAAAARSGAESRSAAGGREPVDVGGFGGAGERAAGQEATLVPAEPHDAPQAMEESAPQGSDAVAGEEVLAKLETAASAALSPAVAAGRGFKRRGRKFACTAPGCKSVFATSFGAKRHQKMHTGARPFQCPVVECSRRFAEKFALSRHMRSHNKERPYTCSFPDCDRRFADKSNLEHHRLTHTAERTIVCGVGGCEKSFYRRRELLRHRNSAHNPERRSRRKAVTAEMAQTGPETETRFPPHSDPQFAPPSQQPQQPMQPRHALLVQEQPAAQEAPPHVIGPPAGSSAASVSRLALVSPSPPPRASAEASAMGGVPLAPTTVGLLPQPVAAAAAKASSQPPLSISSLQPHRLAASPAPSAELDPNVRAPRQSALLIAPASTAPPMQASMAPQMLAHLAPVHIVQPDGATQLVGFVQWPTPPPPPPPPAPAPPQPSFSPAPPTLQPLQVHHIAGPAAPAPLPVAQALVLAEARPGAGTHTPPLGNQLTRLLPASVPVLIAAAKPDESPPPPPRSTLQ